MFFDTVVLPEADPPQIPITNDWGAEEFFNEKSIYFDSFEFE